jgi:hypothetical protein
MQSQNSRLSYPIATSKYSQTISKKECPCSLPSASEETYASESEENLAESSLENSSVEPSNFGCNKIEMKIKTDIL